ncbi:hypothetical protein COO60DRAFT_1637784 [Scenedesmus sp. NREL 46B-D3]|nr:hypothetical protein COO60DRAFT_1637784 [Scenedesmus sp. NREL 46B-D3]
MEGSTGMLAALPAHSLTHLDLRGLHGPVHGPAVSAALARLTNLQRLRVAIWRAPYSCLAGVAQLNQLTWLELGGSWAGDCEQLLQLLAQLLPLQVLHLHISSSLPSLDLSRLTQLRELHDFMNHCDAVFPPQLQQLELGDVPSATTLQSVMQLQQLRRLMLAADLDVNEPRQLLSSLAQLPALQQLSLRYATGQFAAAAAATWPQLPQLCELAVCCSSYEEPNRQAWLAIANCMAASTKLELDAVCICDGEDDEGEDVDATWASPCAKLAGLTYLKDLSIRCGSELLAPGDALALTALTGVRRLVLYGDGAGVGDEAAAALASSCQQLHELDLRSCSLVSMACLSNVAHLTQLTELWLAGNSGPTPQGLMLLTGLKRLQILGVDRDAEVTDEVVESFWAAVTGQQQL